MSSSRVSPSKKSTKIVNSVEHCKKKERLLFIKRLFKNPKALGAIMPSSKALARKITSSVHLHDDSYVVEVGAGTGSFTRMLLEQGLSPKKLFVVELDSELCQYLRIHFPEIQVIQGDASCLTSLLPSEIVGHVSTIISGIPLVNLSRMEQSTLIKSLKSVLQAKGKIVQFTYGFVSPVLHKDLGLEGERLGVVFQNVPPATVWSYKIAQ